MKQENMEFTFALRRKCTGLLISRFILFIISNFIIYFKFSWFYYHISIKMSLFKCKIYSLIQYFFVDLKYTPFLLYILDVFSNLLIIRFDDLILILILIYIHYI